MNIRNMDDNDDDVKDGIKTLAFVSEFNFSIQLSLVWFFFILGCVPCADRNHMT